jgi:glycosyltransferase involved in cell wall biosynthesis
LEPKNLPLVSLAIPVFNGAKYLRLAIDSAFSQTYSQIEIIVINDGSCDGGETESIALSYGDKLKYHYKTNGGVGSALNFALTKATGKYFCWLSHDDLYLPEKIAKQVEFLEAVSRTDVVVFCRHRLIDANGELLDDFWEPPKFNPDEIAYQLLLEQWLHCCSVLAPRAMFFEVGGFREDLPTTQDYDVLFKIGLRHPFYEIPETLLYSRRHSEQGSLSLEHKYEVEHFFNEHIPMLSKEYMTHCFPSMGEIGAWEALALKMSDRGFAEAIVVVFQQMLRSGISHIRLSVFLNVFEQIFSNRQHNKAQAEQYKAQAEQYKGQAEQYKDQAEQYKDQAEQYKDQAEQFLVELTKHYSSWSYKSMTIFKNLIYRIGIRYKGFSSLLKKSTSHQIFDEIYNTNYWRGESRSGEGSDLIQTKKIRETLPSLLQSLGAKTMLDIPCGDYYWMQHVPLPVSYIGGDIVEQIVRTNNQKYADRNHKFLHLDICVNKLPKVDLIFARDLLVHLSYGDIRQAINNMKQSGSTWLLTTTFTERVLNTEIATGDWRTLNLQLYPFNFPEPLKIINEGCTQFNGDYADKSLGLWRLADVELWD